MPRFLVPLFKKLVPNHLRRDVHRVRRFLPFPKGVGVIADVHRDLAEFQAELAHLVDEFARVFHAVHRKAHLFYRRDAEHPVSVVRIGKAYARDDAGKYPAAHEDDLSEKRNVGIGLHDESRPEYHV